MTEAEGNDENLTITAPLAKLSLPRLAHGIARPRLFTVLDEARLRAATWIASPGGSGKTTLVATYLLVRKPPYLWYQLDKDDADPATFFYYLGIAAKHASPDKALFLPLLTPEYLPDIPGFARRYFRKLFALLPSGTVLVLDNYQEVDDAAIFSDILRSAIGEIPEGGHLLVISRTDPPPALARHRAMGALNLLDWETLRLTLDETQSIVIYGSSLDDKSIRTLHERSDGWPAAVTLMLEHIKRSAADNWDISSGSLETVFHFFANEFFNTLPETTQNFLLMTALFSHITPTLAEQLSGNSEAGSILADLHRRHFFTHLCDLEETSYQYHALFREFLLARAVETYTRDQYLALTSRAGRLLNERHRSEEAVILYLRAQDWEMAIPLLLNQAPHLLAQGRAQILAEWLKQIPETLIVATPWLLYWKGMSQQFIDPFAARRTLERANAEFVSSNDVIGQMLVASAIIDITYILRQAFTSALPWIETLQDCYNTHPEIQSSTIESRILTSIVALLTFTAPQEPRLLGYANRLSFLLYSDIDINQKVFSAGHLLYYTSLVAGDREASERIMAHIMPLIDSPELSIVNQIFWRHMCVLPFLLAGQIDAAYEVTRPVLILVRENNLLFLEFIANVYEMFVTYHINNRISAKSIIMQLPAILSSHQPMDMAWLQLTECWYALMKEDWVMVLSHAIAARNEFSNFSSPTFEMEMTCLIANARCESAEPDEALDLLLILKQHNYSKSPRLYFQILLTEAYAYLIQGNREKCHISLREALSIGCVHRYFGNLFWFSRLITRLCAEALRTGIEVDYVRQLIRKRKLLPEDSTIDHWPWPVRVYTLGQFKVMLNDQEIPELKAQRKPFALLQSLIALGGAEVKIDRITEIVWPDAEGDAAVSAFTTTVSRLRKLIGEHAIIVKGGRMSLNERCCWVDVRALERQLDLTDIPESNNARDCAEKLLSLYRGAFLSDEDGEWIQRRRRRLREKFSRRFTQCLNVLRTTEKNEMAAHLLERAMDIDADIGHSFMRSVPVFTPTS